MKKIIKENKIYILFFIALSFLACFFSPMGDDLMWGTNDGLELLKNRFVDYNGRYLGNISAIVLTRIPRLLPLVKGFVLTGIIYLMQKMAPNKNKDMVYLSATLFVFPSLMLIQGIVWTAGFSNYCLSSLIIMASLYIVFYKQDRKLWHIPALIVMGIAGQLFMETYTLFSLMMAVCAVVYFAYKNKKPDWASITYLVSCVLGAVIMFSNSVYVKIVTEGTKYQNIEGKTDSVTQSLLNFFESIFSKVLANMLIGCYPAIVIILIICFVKMKKSGKKSKAVIYGLIASLLASIIFAVRIIMGLIKYKNPMHVKGDLGVLTLIIFVAAALMIVSFFDKQQKRKVLMYFLMIMSTSIPFCVIGPVGARCFMPAYIMFIMIINTLYDFKNNRIMSVIFKVAATLVFVINTVCYMSVYSDYVKKVEMARQQIAEGKTVVQLEHTKLGKMAHAPDGEEDPKERRRFCEYHNFPDYISFKY